MLLLGLLGFGATMLVFSFVRSIAAIHVEGALSGMCAAAVPPVVAAMIGSSTTTEQGRARRFAFIGMAGIAGFLLGPMMGVFVTRLAEQFFTLAMPAGSAAGGLLYSATALPGAPFVLTAGLTVVGFVLSLGLPRLLEFPGSSPGPRSEIRVET